MVTLPDLADEALRDFERSIGAVTLKEMLRASARSHAANDH
jgi:hypothetical protein